MAKYRITGPDGASYEITAPDGATQEQVLSFAQSQWAAQPKEPPKATPAQRVVASLPGRIVQGGQDILDAGAQYLPWALGAATGGFGLAPNPVSKFFFDESDKVSRGITEREKVYQAARAATGQEGFDGGRMLGNAGGQALITMAAGGSNLPTTTLGRAGFGAAMGGASAAATPVVGATSETLGGEKGAQAAIGAALGAVATPIAGKAFDVLGDTIDKIGHFFADKFGKSAQVSQTQVLERLRFDLAREKINFDEFPEAIRQRVARDVAEALRTGQKIDGAALLRKLDIEALGGVPTLGTITRDPSQWTREFNLRGVEGAGESLMNAANTNRQAMGDVFKGLGSQTADDAYGAATKLSDLLRQYDAPVKGAVDATYRAARDESGRYAAMNVPQFSKLANDALDEGQLGAFLPAEARTILNRVSLGEIPLNVNTYTQIRSVLQGKAADMMRQGDRQGALAVGKIVQALDATDIDSAAGEAAKQSFDLARKAAAFRFGKQDAVPALKAVINGDFDADKFVSKYVLNAGTDDLGELAKVLPAEGRNIVRAQIAKRLEDAAFGTNVTGDAAMATERYAKALGGFGKRKLAHFFDPQEIEQMYRVARVGGYLSKPPAGAAPNYSGTASALANLLQRAQGASLALPVVRQFNNERLISSALSAQPPADTLPILSPALRDLLPLVPIGAGSIAANP